MSQGIAGVDFSVASGGTCTSNAAYVAGQQCTVNVIFAPQYPGLRRGAVLLKAADGSLLGSTLIAGVATGSLPVLNPGRIDTVAGDGELNYRADGVPATQAPIFLPYGVVVDPAGNIYLSDTNNNRVRRVDAQSGLISTIAGNGGSGYSGDGGPATQATISQPCGLAIDGAGNLYFADSGNAIIRRIDAISGIITTVAGTPSAPGYSGDGSAATSAELSSPRGLTFDAAGDLFVADTNNNVIREVAVGTGTISTVAGTGIAGYSTDGVLATGAQLNSPWTVSIGADNAFYIADLGNNRVRKVTSGVISTVAGTGNRGFSGDAGAATSAELNDPTSVILDPAGNLYIADSGNNRVRKVYNDTGYIETLAGNDSEQFSGDTGPANNASLYAPYALFFGQSGNLFVADTLHNRIRRILASPFALVYPVMRVGKTSAPQIEGLENDGNDSLSVASPVFNNAALNSATTTCVFTTAIAPSALCNLGVEFAPTSVGSNVTGSVTLNSNAGNSPTVINVSGQVLSVEPTTTSLTSSVNPSILNQSVTFTATVASADPSRSGPVTFLDGTTAICSNVALSSGSATCTTSTLALGQHNITASYAGDTNNASSVSAVLAQVVKYQPTLVLTVAPNPASVSQNVTMTLTATAPTGTPTGTVLFFDGNAQLTSQSLNGSGVATYSTTQLTPARHNLYAQYAGDANDSAGQSNSVDEAITQLSTTTTATSSSSTIFVGAPVTFTATVSNASSSTPTGTVQFMEGSTVLGAATLDGSGHGTLTLSTLSPGTHSIVSSYLGDTDNSGSTSAAFVQTVQQIPTTTSTTSDMNPATAGAVIHLTATITIGSGAQPDGVIAGNVTFSDGQVVLGNAPVNSSGVAVIAVNTLSVGNHNLSASYPGSTNYNSSTSGILVQTITSTATSTTLTSGAGSSLAGQPVTLTASVTSSTGIPTGNVIFRDGNLNIGQAQLTSGGVATFSTSTLSVGTHTLTAAYGGDGNYTASISAPVVETISLASTGVTLAGPSQPSTVGSTISISASLTGNGTAPTGSLTLQDGNLAIATQTVTNTGTFTFSTSTLAVGTHTLTVAYSGDADNSPATSNSITVTVQQSTTATTLFSSTNPSVAGRSLVLTASVTSSGANLAGSVSFADGGAVLGTVTLGANGAATFSTSSLVPGSHTLTAVYSGDTNHSASTSSGLGEQIVQADSLALTSSVNPSVSGTGTVFTVKVTGAGSPVPTGAVTITDGGVTLTTVPLDGTGSASFQTAALTVGSHSIAASYPGDGNYEAAASSLIQTVGSASTQTTLVASANPATYGSPLILTASVTSNGGVAAGTIDFSDAGMTIGTAAINANGVATLTTSSLTPGLHTLLASYAGDGRASASASPPLPLDVRQITSIALASSVNPALTLGPITLTATIAASVTPSTGAVSFSDGATQLGTAMLDATGHAVLTVPALAAGTHTLVATYAGDNADFSSASAPLVELVQLRPTTTSLTASADPNHSQQITLLAIVRWTGSTTPTGNITFTNGNTVLGQAPLTAQGVTTLLTSALSVGPHTLTAEYQGDSYFNASTSTAVVATISLASTGVTLAGPAQASSVGSTITFTASLTGDGTAPTGSLTLRDGNTVIATQTVTSTGTFSFNTSTLAVGTHTITVSYAGDSSNSPATSNSVTVVVQQSTTATTLAASANPATYGSPLILNASVAGNGANLTGSVSFADGGTILGAANVGTGGTATLTTSSLAAGPHTLTATYSGDTNHAVSTSSGLNEQIVQVTNLALASSVNPSLSGLNIVFTVKVTGSNSLIPTGNITFTDSGNTLGTITLDGTGSGSFQTAALAIGSHSVAASYPGDRNYQAAASSLTQTVQSASTQVALTSSGSPAIFGTPLVLTAGVTSNGTNLTGSVTFVDGGTTLGSVSLSGNGTAAFTTSAMAVGSHILTAIYSGDPNHAISTSPGLSQQIVQAASLALLSSANPSIFGAGTVFTVKVTGIGTLLPTGSIILTDGGTALATVTLDSTGSGTFQTAALPVGLHTIAASYPGDRNYQAGTGSLIQTVQSISTQVALTGSANPSVAGQSLILTASVTGSGVNLTGSVSFADGGTLIGLANLSANGTATFTTSSLLAGSHTLTAVYSGDTNHAGSTSSGLSEGIVQVAGLALTSSVNPSLSGSNSVFTVRVTGVGSLVPTGSVTITDGGTLVATVTLNGTGSGSFHTASLAVGSHTITASYPGDGNYQAAVSSLIQTVENANTQVALTASANPATYGSPLTLTASVTGNGGVPTGTVDFSDAGTTIATATINAGGVATVITSSLAPGLHSILASYAGDGRDGASASLPLALNVRQVTSLTLVSSANPALTLSPVTLTASIATAVIQATGSVTFSDGAVQLGSAVVDTTGHAVITVPALPAGNHTIVATYAGDNDDYSSISAPLVQLVQLRPTTTSLIAAAPDPANPQKTTLVAIVKWTGTTLPTGTITFTNGNTVIGSSPIDQNGSASLVVNISTTDNIVATYNGDAAYGSSTSPNLVVKPAVPPQFTVSLDPSSVTLQRKQQTVVNLTTASVQGFADTLQLGCLGLPYAATCTFSNVHIQLAANGSSTVQLTIDTGDPLGAGVLVSNQRSQGANMLMCFLPGCAFASFTLFFRRRFSPQGLLLLLCAAAVTASATGCAGLQINGTPAGSYTFHVTAFGQSTGLTESREMTLVVTQ